MFTPTRSTKPSPLGYANESPNRQFRQGSYQYTSRSPNGSPQRNMSNNTGIGGPGSPMMARRTASATFNNLAPWQIQELRESFHILDKDGDGVINQEDLSSMLASFGQDASPATVGNYFSSVPSPFSLASYLSTMSTQLANLSPREDLLAAFEAFDETDDGSIDVNLLMETLADMGMKASDVEHVCRGWTSKKPGMGMRVGGGEKFKYKEFVDTVSGKPVENVH